MDDLVRVILGGAALIIAALSWRLVGLVQNPYRRLSLQWIAASATGWAVFEWVAALDWLARPWDAWLSRAAVTITVTAAYVTFRSIRRAEGLE